MPQALGLAIVGWAMVAVLMTAIWLWHLRLQNVGVVDVGWTASLVALACLYAFLGPGMALRRGAIAAMIAVWGTRLCAYLLRDRVLGRPEDPRYADVRARDSWVAAGSFFPFFQAQALLAAILSLPALLAAFNPSPQLSALEWSAMALWAVAPRGRGRSPIASWKRSRRRRRRDGKTLQGGLWRYSRHPNYFFEWLVWVAYAMFALTSPWGALALVSPAIMLYLLCRMTGIPATEAQAVRSRGDDYRRYQQTTSAFVPWPPPEVVVIETLLDRDLVPDSVVRLGIRRIVAARLREQEAGGSEGRGRQPGRAPEVAPHPADCGRHGRRQRPALRVAAAVLRTRARSTREVQQRVVAAGCLVAGRCRNADAPAHDRARADRRWRSHSRARVRLGIADAVSRAPISFELHHGRLELCSTARVHRREGARLRVRQRRSGRRPTSTTSNPAERFDRIVSVEMLEHVRNYPRLFARIRHWLTDDGRVFRACLRAPAFRVCLRHAR